MVSQSLKTEFDEEEDDSTSAANGSTASTSGKPADAPARAEATRTFPTGPLTCQLLPTRLARNDARPVNSPCKTRPALQMSAAAVVLMGVSAIRWSRFHVVGFLNMR